MLCLSTLSPLSPSFSARCASPPRLPLPPSPSSSQVRGAVEDMMVHGMTKSELEALMHRVFAKADSDRCE